ncbi:MAG: aminomethyl-transferring glycine dehydrogenase subunit GcvPB [Candidatus Brocadia sp.]|uniref:Probable glycine dehydrogenase (decarboxylating) subunit 2 n=1 Tax=Candidatus Brocadia fulgida TaxID=380242 RepID=A0A0M2UWS9_9BACT|nr:MAG: glycine dehydrogenase subunit II [Candidatus Brocadia fulgida]MCC6324517.1 aminomethyl-transferring glycine dehydrogenase subunit GcvPB [Candidatus Brocadia sp.]MCE7911056.1 glycine dehydrogenase subunit 2 [Candidatus Brocadia sp. AMX3]MBV6519516.1 putative glycine dehydrogenase (decarboxylating) subunit 2 [Candidatus Brocadia fulgida]MDG5997024.1 glycine dehydrogenase subunit 2 [Candidatus Brocadia sp.]
MDQSEPLIFEKSSPGRRCFIPPVSDVPEIPITNQLPQKMLRKQEVNLPEVSEIDVVRHFTRLSQKNFCVDTNFYPLGSCTMKYNPKINEDAARLEGFTKLHPYQPTEQCQGILELLYALEQMLITITGMDAFTLQPAAGAHGELTGMLIIRAYLEKQGEKRHKIIIPDSAHGTNPASAALCGYEVESIRSNTDGLIDVNKLKNAFNRDTAAVMITNPNTLGLFEKEILEICKIAHNAGGLVYCDGANMNALLGIARPGDMGIDILHLNLHKTFSTPHGGGGPGAGPIGVTEKLKPFLPVPRIESGKESTIVDRGKDTSATGSIPTTYVLNYQYPDSIGRVRAFYGHIGMMIRTYTYLLSLGKEGVGKVGEFSILNANYLRHKLIKYYDIPYGKTCMHEFVISAKKQRQQGASALDIAKRLLDCGFHSPTIYFPLIVEEALMIEPTETESPDTLDAFADVMIQIARDIEQRPGVVRDTPKNTPVGRPDEVKAAREPVLKWKNG